jgi:hypothetical protein
MRRPGSLIGWVAFLVFLYASSWAASEQALKLRHQNGLSAFTPPEGFLSGNFLADETDPAFIFGQVRDFAQSLQCPATWLIEESERRRIEKRAEPASPVEYSIYLEADCPDRVTYYVFVDRSFSSAQWLEWRRQFHKNKAEPHYRAAKESLEQAARDGFAVDGELRFVAVNGDLVLKRPEELITGELGFPPIYDLRGKQALKK